MLIHALLERLPDIATPEREARAREWLARHAADLDEATLKAVSEISGGTFFRARTLEELRAAYDALFS